MTSNAKPRFRKHLLLPSEHGSWSWLLVPYFVGVIVGGAVNLAVILIFTGSMATFLLRQSASLWVRARRGNGRLRDIPILKKIITTLTTIAILSFVGLMALGLTDLLLLALLVVPFFMLYLFSARQKQSDTRVLGMEVAGSAALALVAPAAMVAAMGALSADTWVIGGLMAAQNVLGVLYVRQRIDDTHDRAGNRQLMLGMHTAVFILILVVAALRWMPLLAVLPALFLLLRALWTYRAPRPIFHIKKFGFSEVGVEIIGGIIIVVAYLIP
jgi:hypothetical protein